jgi:hypothetical protein
VDEGIAISWLLQPLPLWATLTVGIVPALIARAKRRPIAPWYLYGLACSVAAWPLLGLPILHALLVRPRGTLAEKRRRQRRADALALLAESSVRSYPSWVAELRRKSPTGIDRRRYAYQHTAPGEPLELIRERADRTKRHAVAYYHRGVLLGYVPKRQRWVAEALDDGLRLVAVAETVKVGWIRRQRASFIGTRIVVLNDGR